MKYMIACAFVLSSAFATPGVLVSSASGQAVCGPDAPAAYLRPGGYCDSIGAGRSLSVPVDPGCTDFVFAAPASLDAMEKGARVHVAVTCTIYCYITGTALQALPLGDRVHLAQAAPPECER